MASIAFEDEILTSLYRRRQKLQIVIGRPPAIPRAVQQHHSAPKCGGRRQPADKIYLGCIHECSYIYGMRWLILTLVAAFWSQAAHAATPEKVARQFADTVFSSENEEKNKKQYAGRLVRWPLNQRIPARMFGDPGRGRIFVRDYDELGKLYSAETSSGWRSETDAGKIQFYIFMIPRDRFKETGVTDLTQRIACFVALEVDDNYHITHARVGIDTDMNNKRVRHCIFEENMQAMGLRNDSCRNYRPTLFCDDDHHLEGPTNADRMLLRILYDPSLKPGMNKEEAMPIVRRLIKKHWSEYMGAE